MDAVTKNWISRETIVEMTHQILKKPIEITNIKKMSGGFCSAVYLIETTDGKKVLKIAPGAEVKVMRHESKYIQTEADIVGIITRQICTIKADCFGIPNIPESCCKKNSEFTYLLFDWLLMDAEEKEIVIPAISPKKLRGLIRKYEDIHMYEWVLDDFAQEVNKLLREDF